MVSPVEYAHKTTGSNLSSVIGLIKCLDMCLCNQHRCIRGISQVLSQGSLLGLCINIQYQLIEY